MRKKTAIISGIITIILLILIIIGVFAYYLTDFEKPETSVRTLEVIGIDEDLNGFTLNIVLEVYNPNPLSLEITLVEGDVLIDESIIGDIFNRTGENIPGKSERSLDLTIHIDDLDSSIVSGSTLSIEGKTRAKYMGAEGESPFQESINLDQIPGGGENIPPIPLIMGPHNARPLEEITFDGSGSRDRDGEIVSYSWEMGDGSTATGESVTHRYTSGGVYNVKLTVEDDQGATNVAAHQVVVSTI